MSKKVNEFLNALRKFDLDDKIKKPIEDWVEKNTSKAENVISQNFSEIKKDVRGNKWKYISIFGVGVVIGLFIGGALF